MDTLELEQSEKESQNMSKPDRLSRNNPQAIQEKTRSPHKIAGWEFLGWWIILTGGSIILVILLIADGYPARFLTRFSGVSPSTRLSIFGAIVGFGVGVLQWLDLEQYTNKTHWWVLACILAGGAGGWSGSGGHIGISLLLFVTAVILGASIGIFPLDVFRRTADVIGWRLLAGIFGSAGIGIMVILPMEFFRIVNDNSEPIRGAFGLIMGMLIISISVSVVLEGLTGIFLLLVLRQVRKTSM